MKTGLKERFKQGLISREDAIEEANGWDDESKTKKFHNWISNRRGVPMVEGNEDK